MALKCLVHLYLCVCSTQAEPCRTVCEYTGSGVAGQHVKVLKVVFVIHLHLKEKPGMALTGNGSASKEQVAGMLQRLLTIKNDEMSQFMDATDALAAAYCHFLQMGRPESDAPHYRGWKDFVVKNQDKVRQNK